jgi:hypothetical protein
MSKRLSKRNYETFRPILRTSSNSRFAWHSLSLLLEFSSVLSLLQILLIGANNSGKCSFVLFLLCFCFLVICSSSCLSSFLSLPGTFLRQLRNIVDEESEFALKEKLFDTTVVEELNKAQASRKSHEDSHMRMMAVRGGENLMSAARTILSAIQSGKINLGLSLCIVCLSSSPPPLPSLC